MPSNTNGTCARREECGGGGTRRSLGTCLLNDLIGKSQVGIGEDACWSVRESLKCLECLECFVIDRLHYPFVPFNYISLEYSLIPILSLLYSTSATMLFYAILTFLPLTTAHYVLNWPTSRGFKDDKASTFPCGGFDQVKTPRTEWPINGGPIQLRMQHTQTRLKVFLGLGDDTGINFNVTIRPMFAQEGLGNFCIGKLNVEGVEVKDGTHATLQVVSNGDPEGGLYQVRTYIFLDWISRFYN